MSRPSKYDSVSDYILGQHDQALNALSKKIDKVLSCCATKQELDRATEDRDEAMALLRDSMNTALTEIKTEVKKKNMQVTVAAATAIIGLGIAMINMYEKMRPISMAWFDLVSSSIINFFIG